LEAPSPSADRRLLPLGNEDSNKLSPQFSVATISGDGRHDAAELDRDASDRSNLK